MRFYVLVALLVVSSLSARAHTGGQVDVICPLDGTNFSTWQDFSGTAFDARLDFKKEGPIAQPWALAQCPKCRYPISEPEKALNFDEIARLKSIVSSPHFLSETKDSTAYYALAIIREELDREPLDIGWVYLCASWEVENNPAKYRTMAEKIILWYDKASKKLGSAPDPIPDYFTACYLPIEINRRLGLFDEAEARIATFPPHTDQTPKWLDGALKFQSKLIANKDGGVHTFSEFEDARPPAKKRPLGPDINTPEGKAWNNLKLLFTAASQYMMENGIPETKYSDLVGPDSDKLVKKIEPAVGEDYTQLVFRAGDEKISIALPNGKTVEYLW